MFTLEEQEAIEKAGLLDEIGFMQGLGKTGELKLINFFISNPMYYDLLPHNSKCKGLCNPYQHLENQFVKSIENQVQAIHKHRDSIKRREIAIRLNKERKIKLKAEQEAFRKSVLEKYPGCLSVDFSKDVERYKDLKSFQGITDEDIILISNWYGFFDKLEMSYSEFQGVFGEDGIKRMDRLYCILNNLPYYR